MGVHTQVSGAQIAVAWVRAFERERQKLCREVRALLMRDWDPIGVAGEPNAIDDYDRYAEHIVGMLQMKQGIGELAAYLDDVATKMMGLRSSPATSRTVADNLRKLA